MFVRKLVSLMVLLAFVFSLSGCGEQKKKNEIVMWLVGSEAQAQTIMDLSRKFTEDTGVKVTCQAISWGDAHSKYLTSIAGEVTPDIGTMGLTWGMEFGELGAMVDLNAEFGADLVEIENANFPGISRSTRVGNSVYGVPFDMTEHIIYYRRDLIPTPPATWDELIKILRDLKASNRGMVLDWGALEWIDFAPFLWQAGGDFFSADYSRVTVDSPEAVNALTFFASLYKESVPKMIVPIEQGMRTGDYPLAISGNWKIISLTLGAPEIKGKWSIAMLPAGPSGKRTAFIGGRIMGVFSRSKMKKEAWEFIKFLSRPEIQGALYKASLETEDAYLPPNMDTWKDLPMDDTFKMVLEQQAKDANGPPPVPGWDSCTMHINQAIQKVILTGADPAAELAEAKRNMEKELSAVK